MNHEATQTHSKEENTKIVMSGMRPTGRLHLGHYLGALQNWVKLQEQYTCYYSIVDWHALTTKYDQTKNLQDNIYEIALDWLAVGLNPSQSTIFIQSAIPEIAELHLLLSMLTPSKWVETDPTLKDMVAMLSEDLTYGLLGYPILQTADILSVLGEYVPVGKDQVAHLEISRDIARRFNYQYQVDLFPEPKPLLTETPLITGLDGRKMGKSYNNGIFLADTEEETLKKIKTAITDKNRIKRDDPGSPENCEVVYPYYQLLAPSEVTHLAHEECKKAIRGCMDCKKILAEITNETLKPIRERRKTFEGDRAQVEKIITEGCEKTRWICEQTLRKVRKAMNMYQPSIKISH